MDASGMTVGLGAGLAIGIAAGRNSLLGAIRSYLDINHVELLRAGSPLPVEQFLVEAAHAVPGRKKVAFVIALILLGFLMLIGLRFYRAG
jgi:hypothetical protein